MIQISPFDAADTTANILRDSLMLTLIAGVLIIYIAATYMLGPWATRKALVVLHRHRR